MSDFKAGDLVGFSGNGVVSDVINIATFGAPRWGLSHIGIIAPWSFGMVMFESTSLAPPGVQCVIQRKWVSGTQAHFLSDIKIRPGKIWHYPLSRDLYPEEERRLGRFLEAQIGRPYDMRGALRSGGMVARALNAVLRPEDLGQLFCSEFVAAAYGNLGILPTANASSYSPNAFVRRCRRHGIVKPRIRLA